VAGRGEKADCVPTGRAATPGEGAGRRRPSPRYHKAKRLLDLPATSQRRLAGKTSSSMPSTSQRVGPFRSRVLGDRGALAWSGRAGGFHGCTSVGAAALCDGRFALAFPSFGPERRVRRSWPLRALDDRRIVDRSAHAICDFAVVLDETLMGRMRRTASSGGRAAVKLHSSPSGVGKLVCRRADSDAGAVARAVLGRAIVNTA